MREYADPPQAHPGYNRFLRCLRDGYTRPNAALEAGINPNLLRQWQRHAARGDRSCQLLESDIAKAENEIVGVATRTLRRIMKDPKALASARVSAAKFVLERRGSWIQEQRQKVNAQVETTAHTAVEFDNPMDRQFDADTVRELSDTEVQAALAEIARVRSDNATR